MSKNRVWMRQKDVDDLDEDAGWCSVYRYEPAPPSREATLVIHQGRTERVFTESEVRAIMQKMEESAESNMRTSAQFPGHRELDESVVHDLIDEACEAFGIVIVNTP